MPDLPARPDLGRLRRQAQDRLRAAAAGGAGALRRIAGWPDVRLEVLRREALDGGDPVRLRALLAEAPELAVAPMEPWCDHPRGASPLGYVAMLRYDPSRRVWGDVAGTAGLARALIEAGAPVDGDPGDRETPLITAASYGDAAVARVLVEAGADVDARAAPDAGGVPGGTALLHAAVFGMTEVIDVLVAAGSGPASLEEAAAAGDVNGFLTPQTPLPARVRALVMAADHQRLAVIDELLAAGTPVDAIDAKWGRQALRVAAQDGRAASVAHLLARGADPDLRDPRHRRTALDCCRQGREGVTDRSFHDRVEAILRPVTASG